jgi:hypothetical protein
VNWIVMLWLTLLPSSSEDTWTRPLLEEPPLRRLRDALIGTAVAVVMGLSVGFAATATLERLRRDGVLCDADADGRRHGILRQLLCAPSRWPAAARVSKDGRGTT